MSWLLWLLPLPLLWLAFCNISFGRLADLFTSLNALQVAALVGVNVLVLATFSARWWIVLLAQGTARVSFVEVSAYRLVSFAVSFFTPGPQFGGEPLQVYFLNRSHDVPTGPALASVALEKTIELTINGLMMAAGAILVVRSELLPELGQTGVVLTLLLMVLPLGLLVLFWSGYRPFTPLIGLLPESIRQAAVFEQAAAAVLNAEDEIIAFCQQRRGALILASLVTIASWVLFVVEYGFALSLFGLRLPLGQVVALVVAARLAFLVPAPGGLGAVEASQVFVMQALGYDPAIGLSLSLLIRVRDLLFGLAGLALGWAMGAQHLLRPTDRYFVEEE
ncbi:MAG: flippase-like domain-containing protein [Chloroflexi bacterium]|nr:flippase-like domain-containing protein [Chloroflexota bacterium]